MAELEAEIRFVAEYDGNDDLLDVSMYIEGGDEPFSVAEFVRGSALRIVFEAAWGYFCSEEARTHVVSHPRDTLAP
jgi:hypothetical protein